MPPYKPDVPPYKRDIPPYKPDVSPYKPDVPPYKWRALETKPTVRVSTGIPGYGLRTEMIWKFFPFPL